jgi:glycerophosphoryl diester phosphodiesterase
MAIPDKIKQLANDIRSKVYGREVRESLAKGIEEAGDLADKANTKSENAVYQVNNIQAQVNQLVVEGDSSVEAAQARVDAEGKSYPTLKARLDAKETEFSSQLAQKAKKSDLKSKAPKNRTLQIIAHRGFAHLAPENTMTAFTLAVNAGAYGLECDVQISSDGVPVLIHDLTVDRTTNGTGNVKDMTLEQLQSLDAGSKAFGEIFSSARIPTFEEFLRFSRSRAKVIYPEIKNVRNVDDIKTIVDLIIDHEMVYKTVISSFTLEHLYEVRKYSSDLNFGYLADVNISETEYDILEEDGNCTLLINYTNVINDPGIVKECNNRNIDIVVWTPNNKNSISQLLDLGVYKIMSDRMFGGWKND